MKDDDAAPTINLIGKFRDITPNQNVVTFRMLHKDLLFSAATTMPFYNYNDDLQHWQRWQNFGLQFFIYVLVYLLQLQLQLQLHICI